MEFYQEVLLTLINNFTCKTNREMELSEKIFFSIINNLSDEYKEELVKTDIIPLYFKKMLIYKKYIYQLMYSSSNSKLYKEFINDDIYKNALKTHLADDIINKLTKKVYTDIYDLKYNPDGVYEIFNILFNESLLENNKSYKKFILKHTLKSK